MSFAMRIEHVVTINDSVTGDPVVPGYGDEFFALVRRLPDGTCMWRSISIAIHADDLPPASRAKSPRRHNGELLIMAKYQRTETESTTLPVVSSPETLAQLDADVAALAAEANELVADVRVGDDLRFRKGEWTKTVGDKDIDIGETATFAFDMLSYQRGWIKWVNKKPVHKIIGRPIDGFVSPVRARLGDLDESKWPRDSKGKPQDPWQENFKVVGRDLGDDRLCTFTTTSWHGPRALGRLLKTYTHERQQHPGMMPVVLLLSETKPTMDFGDVDAPLFKVVDWKPFGEGASPPGMKLPPPVLPKVAQILPPKSGGGGFDDEVPFAPSTI
jgi:hypothetical protein